jgi:L-ribulose-5-phosphate 4-epimerase
MSNLCQLKHDVFQANLSLVKHNLVTLTWGNASGVDRERGLVVIKPSGVPYDVMTADDMVVVDLATGATVDSKLKPSSDLATHLALYRAWPDIGGVVHAHSLFATTFAQACRGVPCLGTTHADHFYGDIPCARDLTQAEVGGEYEANTGAVIIECFAQRGLTPLAMPAVLVARHGPFTWGKSAAHAVEQAVALEHVCHMAQLAAAHPDPGAFPKYVLDKHYGRKHGPNAYYEQLKK